MQLLHRMEKERKGEMAVVVGGDRDALKNME